MRICPFLGKWIRVFMLPKLPFSRSVIGRASSCLIGWVRRIEPWIFRWIGCWQYQRDEISNFYPQISSEDWCIHTKDNKYVTYGLKIIKLISTFCIFYTSANYFFYINATRNAVAIPNKLDPINIPKNFPDDYKMILPNVSSPEILVTV